jgi:hypothetical protein
VCALVGFVILPDTRPSASLIRLMKQLRAKPKPRTIEEVRYKPGDSVPASGIYCIEHEPHRLMHTATLLVQSRFPRCKQCGDAVRFTLIRKVQDWRAVPFRSTAILEEYPDDLDSLPKAG